MLRSDQIVLRPLERTDLETLARWRNEPQIHRWFFNIFPITLSGQENWYQGLLKDQQRQLFVIQTIAEGRAIGTIGFDHIDWKNQKAELGNVLIGEPTYRGQGLGKEAVGLMIDFGFIEMNLNRIYLEVYASNAAAIHVYKACGFKTEGILREVYFKGGAFQDLCLMAILRKHYETILKKEG